MPTCGALRRNFDPKSVNKRYMFDFGRKAPGILSAISSAIAIRFAEGGTFAVKNLGVILYSC